MKKSSIFVLLLCLVFLLSGCDGHASDCSTGSIPDQIKAQTMSNWTYICLNLEGSIEENVSQIDEVISQWEALNPSKKITSVVPIYEFDSAYGYGDFVDGLSIYSEQK